MEERKCKYCGKRLSEKQKSFCSRSCFNEQRIKTNLEQCLVGKDFSQRLKIKLKFYYKRIIEPLISLAISALFVWLGYKAFKILIEILINIFSNFNFLSINGVGITIVMMFMALILCVYVAINVLIKKFPTLAKINNIYAIMAFILIISLFFVGFNLITKNYPSDLPFNDLVQTERDVGLTPLYISCSIQNFDTFVVYKHLTCLSVFSKNNVSQDIYTERITITLINKKDQSQENLYPGLLYTTMMNNTMIVMTDAYLPKEGDFIYRIFYNFNNTAKYIKEVPHYWFEKDIKIITMDEYRKRTYEKIYLSLLLLPILIFTVFAGMNNLKELMRK